MERAQVQYGRTRIGFQVQRSRRRKQVSLVVDPGHHRLLVLAPVDVDVARLRVVVRHRGAGVLEKLRQVQEAELPTTAHEFVSGEGFTYLGRSFRLRVREAEGPEPARLEGGWLVVTVRHRLSLAARRQAVRAAVIACFKTRSAESYPSDWRTASPGWTGWSGRCRAYSCATRLGGGGAATRTPSCG